VIVKAVAAFEFTSERLALMGGLIWKHSRQLYILKGFLCWNLAIHSGFG